MSVGNLPSRITDRIRTLNFKTISRAASVLIIAGAVAYALFVIIRGRSYVEISKVHFQPVYLIISFLIAYSGTLFGAIPVWRQILAKIGVHQSLQTDICIYTYSALGSILPGSIWTIAGRATLYHQSDQKGLTATLASILEVIIVGIAGFILYTITTIIDPRLGLWASHPWIGIVIILASLTLIHPKVFRPLTLFFLRKIKKEEAAPVGNYRIRDLSLWVAFEIAVTIVGGVSIFALLKSILPVSWDLLIPVISAWAASVTVGTVFLWLPGSPVLRDGAMAIILSVFISPANAILFVVILRVWIIVSIMLLAALIWLLLDRSILRKSGINP